MSTEIYIPRLRLMGDAKRGICGGSRQVYKSTLYGRRTAQFRVTRFNYFDSAPFLDGFANIEKAVLYGITSGIPEYLRKIDGGKSLKDNIIDLFLTASGHLFEEPGNLIKQELREPSTYNGIIEAIAHGASRLNEISTECGIESNKCAKYLSSLQALGIIKKELPVTESLSKKSIYVLNDYMFRFWYRFVFPNMSAVVSELGENVYAHTVEPQLSGYMGLAFEEICKQYLLVETKNGSLPFFVGKLGRWWGNNPGLKRQEEIDILGFHDNNAIFCECKWTNAPMDSDVLDDLIEQNGLLFLYIRQNRLY